ncbi:MAG: DUF2249 domain-containing protein [Cryobacterium sp.]|jgi:uncharacterized protein (DUF2249 family)|nr:DUF2249 domain-containing protein [Cryobacterium sp.]
MTSEPIRLQTSAPAQVSGGAKPASSGCACGHADENEIVLDVRQIPHAIRHATIFGAIGAIAPGFSLDLVADHNPLPLLAQLDERNPGEFVVSYLEEGPDVWKLRLARQ